MASTEAARRADVEAIALVPAPPDAVFEFLTDLRNHWLLAGRFVEVVSLEGADGNGSCGGGWVRLRGPLRVRRTAHTRVVEIRPNRVMVGTAEVGTHTRACVRWTLQEWDGATSVRLAADVERAGRLDRLLLALGGRAWLRRRFAGTLDRVVEIFAERQSAAHADAVPPASRAQRSTESQSTRSGVSVGR